jgi:hypothetical protein
MSSRLTPAIALTLAIVSWAVAAPAHAVVIDQSHTPEIFSAWSLAFMGPVGQEFVPTVSPLNVVELWISHGMEGSEPASDITVRVREGAIDGAVLGESLPVHVAGEVAEAMTFTFTTPVILTPGAVHVLEAVVAPGGGNPMIGGSETPDYPDGRAILLGQPVPADLWFRTGATEDVPSAATTWGALKALF